MSTFIKNTDGSESEVFTKEELEKKLAEVTESANKAVEESIKKQMEEFKNNNTEQLQELKNELAEAKSRLDEGEGEGEGEEMNEDQKARLIKQRDEAREQLKSFEDIKKEVAELKNIRTGDVKKELLDSLSNGNKEVKDKIDFYYDSFKGEANTKEEIQSRINNAYNLFKSSEEGQNILDNIGGSGTKGDTRSEVEKHVPTDNEKNIGSRLGISDADREKYLNK